MSDPAWIEAVFQACEKDEVKKVEELLNAGDGKEKPNVNVQGIWIGSDKITPLHVATNKASVNCVLFLLARGADPTLQDSSGYTAMHEGARSGNLQIVTALIKAKADVGAKSIKDIYPIHLAAGKGHYEMVRFLLQHRADQSNVQHFAGVTPMHLAAMSKQQMPIPELIAAGANPNIQDSQGCTVLHYACRMALPDLVGYLLDRGADPTIRNTGGALAKEEIGVWAGNTPQNVQTAINQHLELPRPPLVAGIEQECRFPKVVSVLITEFIIGPLTVIRESTPQSGSSE